MTAFIITAPLAAVACNYSDDSRLTQKKICLMQANKNLEELKNATLKLLSLDISETVMENNSCDSGSGDAYLSFEVERSVSQDEILKKFLSQGWRKIDPPNKDCIACVAQVEKVVNDKFLQLSILDRKTIPNLEIEVSYR